MTWTNVCGHFIGIYRQPLFRSFIDVLLAIINCSQRKLDKLTWQHWEHRDLLWTFLSPLLPFCKPNLPAWIRTISSSALARTRIRAVPAWILIPDEISTFFWCVQVYEENKFMQIEHASALHYAICSHGSHAKDQMSCGPSGSALNTQCCQNSANWQRDIPKQCITYFELCDAARFTRINSFLDFKSTRELYKSWDIRNQASSNSSRNNEISRLEPHWRMKWRSATDHYHSNRFT